MKHSGVSSCINHVCQKPKRLCTLSCYKLIHSVLLWKPLKNWEPFKAASQRRVWHETVLRCCGSPKNAWTGLEETVGSCVLVPNFNCISEIRAHHKRLGPLLPVLKWQQPNTLIPSTFTNMPLLVGQYRTTSWWEYLGSNRFENQTYMYT